jgi:hypothetical protein
MSGVEQFVEDDPGYLDWVTRHPDGQLAVFIEPVRKLWMSSSRRAGGAVQEMAACTSSATFFSTAGLHLFSAYVTGHTSPSSRFAVSWKPRVE